MRTVGELQYDTQQSSELAGSSLPSFEAGHDLLNALSALTAYLQGGRRLLRHGATDERLAEALAKATEQAARATNAAKALRIRADDAVRGRASLTVVDS